MELLLIRHARPARATRHELGDPGLTDEGRRQAGRLAEFLAAPGTPRVDALYSSPMRRAGETAAALAAATGLPLHVDDDLAEFDTGASHYVPSEERTDDPRTRWDELRAGRWDGEEIDLDAFRRRVVTCLEQVVDRHASEVVGVVCHFGVINAYVADVLGLPSPFFFEPHYTSVTRVMADRSGRRTLRSANETAHLLSTWPRPQEETMTTTPTAAPPAPSTRLHVTHALRVLGLATPQSVSRLTGLPVEDVADALTAAERDTLVQARTGRLTGWALTPEGRRWHARALAEELERSGRRAEVEHAYEAFVALNQPFKQICTSWQLKDGAAEPNDHSDAAYDQSVLDRLEPVHRAALELTRRLADALPRFGWYPSAFSDARDRLRGGDRRALSAPLSESYHDLWMALHQDLLSTLGRERSAKDGH
ncbi:histidine phosphatase family protein [Xylanimonas allomyrinae]|uniref:Histidine phosphatase family protein n=1 Tax=Xylanimonas allomyrinae TaxID=2509459 RepID=A0A4P6EIM5_9MICO|nr:histidine phosphatase family protein [Xylanimonas allomyrinae]QAY62284.1 histidine phosphatase family protein [Xylanimonas allomyrinae]